MRMRETIAPPRRQTTAITANTVAGSETCNSTPATNGPRRMPALSIMPDATFAAVRSSGVFVIAGRSADCTGLVNVMLHEATAASA